MNKSNFLFFGLLVTTFTFAQSAVVSRSGKLVTVNTPSTTTSIGLVQLAGDLGGTATAPTISNAAVISKVLTGYTSSSGTVTATDNIVDAIGKLNGNVNLKAPIASPTFTGIPAVPTASAGTTGTQIASLDYVLNAAAASAPDATTTATGKIKLAGDIAGTALIPKISGIQGTAVDATVPTANQVLRFDSTASKWVPSSVAALVANNLDAVTPAAGQTAFTLTKTPLGTVSFFINGVRVPNTAITVSGTSLTYVPANNDAFTLATTDVVVIIYVAAI